MKKVPLKSTELNSWYPDEVTNKIRGLHSKDKLQEKLYRKHQIHTNSNARVAVDSLNQLLALMADNPVRIYLRCAFRI